MKREERVLRRKVAAPKDISLAYGIAVGTLANMRYRKTGPKYYRCGRSVYYRIDEFEDWQLRNPVLTSESLPEGGNE